MVGIINRRLFFSIAFFSGAVGLTILSVTAGRPGIDELNPQRNNAINAAGLQRGLYRGMPVTYVIKDGKRIFQGDILLDRIITIANQTPASPREPNSNGIAYGQYLWPRVGNQYQIPYVIAAGSGNVSNLNSAIAQFNSTFSNIQFVPRTTEADYVSFYFDPNNNTGQCESNVGRIGGEQQVGGAGGSSNPCSVATVLHEMGHTVGLWHEQSRADRDTYVTIRYDDLIKASRSNFDPIYDNAQITTLFDYASIMQYPAYSFSRNGGPAIESVPAGIPLSNQTGYTAADIDGVERLYGNAPTSVTVTSNPAGLQVIVDGVTITTPQTFNWALNSVHTLDVPPNVQSQPGYIVGSNQPTTFYYFYGRWNDSVATSHSIMISPGNGDPTAPATSPAVTTYSANFIQVVPYSVAVFPTGTGTVTPSPTPQSYPGSGLLFYTARQQVTLTASANAGQNFYEFNNAPFWLPGGLGANPKTFYVPDTGLTINTTTYFSPSPVYAVTVAPNSFSSNLWIYADGDFWYAPKNFSAFYDSGWTPGSMHTLSVDDPEYPYSFASRFAFNQWNDGTPTATRTVNLGATSTTYTANLIPQFYVTDYVNQSCAGSISVTPPSPTGDGFYPNGQLLNFSEAPASGWTFSGWQYDLSGTSSSQPLTVTDEVLVAADYNTTAIPLALTSLNPSRAFAGGGDFILTLNGTGFTPGSVVSVNGAFPQVTFIDSTRLTVPVMAAQIATPGAFQVWVENFPSGATCAAFVALPFTVANATVPTPTSVVSRKIHGGAGTFDVNLPLSGTPGVECRTGGATRDYQIVVTFPSTVTVNGNPQAEVTLGTATIGSGGVGNGGNVTVSGNTVTIPLTNVANVQTLNVRLNGVNSAGNITIPMSLLIGDTSGNGTVNAADVSQTKARLGQVLSSANFRSDVNANGTLNAADTAIIKANLGNGLP
jgi:Astacin (Peptidase family M12A)/Dockerin type I domain